MKTKNRLLASILCLLAVVFCVVGLSACNGDDDCSHKWGEWTATTNATCTEAGVQERKCSECGETETSAIDALGHDFADATCSTPKTCKTCSITEGTVAAHAYIVETVKDEAFKSAASCTSAAVYYKSCACGDISTSDADVFTSGVALEHKDDNTDHVCDYGCGKSDVGAHADKEGDHVCDYGCGNAVENYIDENKDHRCDCGCGKKVGVCVDADFDHACDYGCSYVWGACEDANYDHACDHGCGKTFGTHSDSTEDDNHVCDYGCGATIESCFDAEGDGDHTCDICGVADVTPCNFGKATCGTPATCSECHATTGATLEHKDENRDHSCDNGCGKNDMGVCADSATDNDHVCDYGCNAVLEDCFDTETDKNHACDVCQKADVTAHDYKEDTQRATAATCEAAATKTYVCNCGEKYTENDGEALRHDTEGVTATEKHISGCEYVMVTVCKRSNCGKEIQGETVYHHTYVASIAAPATCTNPGQKTFRCSTCGDTSKEAETIPADATGHAWTSGTVESGVRTDECSICHTTKTVVVSDSNTASSNASDLANTDLQLKVEEGTNANIQLGQDVADAIGDQNITISAGVVDESTLKGMGVSEDQLKQIGENNTVYDFTMENENGDPISDFGEDNFVTITLPYTLKEGEDIDSIAVWFISDTCQVEACDKGANCVDAHKLVSIEATYNNGFVTFQTNHFSIYTVTRLTPAERCALYGHGYAEQVVEGSCTKDGYVLLVCVRCHDKQIKENTFVKAEGHDYTTETHEATCTTNGYVLYACNNCAHSYKTKINATGHAWDVVDSAEASCTADGYTTYACGNCSEEYTVTSAKLAHVYTDTVVPATCVADGYTIHDCDNCAYSYTDAYVNALGHSYGEGVWSWEANGNKATLTLTCAHDAAHATVLHVISTMDKVVEKGECSNYVKRTHTASVEYNGVTYTDVMVIRQGNPKHKFSSEWTWDENEHWHECVCGAKEDVIEHSFENATTTKDATCSEAGESTSYCACGATHVTEIPATGDHNYVDGVCDGCGAEEIVVCDHTELHSVSVNFGELGACAWTLYYNTCECGEVKIIDDDRLREACDMEYTRGEKYTDENGIEWTPATASCSICGMEYRGRAAEIEEGCSETYVEQYDAFIIDGVTVLENIRWEETYTHHRNYQVVSIDLAEYGACGGTLSIRKCADCNANLDVYDIQAECNADFENEPETETITDENGVVHYIQKVECPDCAFTVCYDYWVIEYSVCEFVEYYGITVACGDTLFFEDLESDFDTDHEYEYNFELPAGASCEDGYRFIQTCSRCDFVYAYMRYSHYTESHLVDLTELGLCGGYANEEHCLVCGTVANTYVDDYSCNWWQKESGDNYTVYQCSACGVTKRIETVVGEKDENCQYMTKAVYTYTLNGETVYTGERISYGTDHNYKYSFDMNGASCEDGYTGTRTCADCGDTYTFTSSRHATYALFELGDGYDCCDRHDVIVYACPCGYYSSLNWYGLSYNSESNAYECSDCGLSVANNTDQESNGCSITETKRISVKLSDEEIYAYEKESVYKNHRFADIETSMVEGAIYITATCDTCGEVRTTEVLTVELEQHDGQYYFDYTFTPEESAVYTITGLSNQDTYVTLYQLTDGGLVQVDYNDDGANHSQFRLATTLTAGTTYVYRIRFYNASSSGNIAFSFAQGASSTVACRHNSQTGFACLLDGAETCEDGALYGTLYTGCGCVESFHVGYTHEVSVTGREDLTLQGACRGELVWMSCACGQVEDRIELSNFCGYWTSNEYYDEEGRLVCVEARSCSTCGFRYSLSYYTVRDRESCTLTYYCTQIVSHGNTLIAQAEYTRVEKSHDYEITANLMDGASSCEDGVVIIYKCKDCEDEYEYYTHYHEAFEKERIDLSTLGSVCGGYASVYGCACGYITELSLDHILCDLGSEWCEFWIEDAVEGDSHTPNGHWLHNDAKLYICAVTDPEEAACAYKIRYAQYWLKDANSCVAYQYQTWQFGYNEETDTCEYEVTFKTGDSAEWHNYVDGSADDCTKYDCPDCGSYYYQNYYYDEDGYIVKDEWIACSTVGNSYYKYCERVNEYAWDADGNRYTSRDYYKYIYSNGREYWRENRNNEEAYTGTFGSGGRKVTATYTSSDGESYTEEYAYVVYKGYNFRIYTHRTEGDSWYRYEYTYSFDDGCMQTSVYTNSEGETEETVENICRFWNSETIKEPTCSQDGEGRHKCYICEKLGDTFVINANDHRWVQATDDWHYCAACGLENTNGVSGSIIMEDLTEAYGDGEYYVVGYCVRNNVMFSQYVSLILADGSEIVVTGIEIVAMDELRAYAVKKADVEAWAAENGYTDYAVKLSFVPVGDDGSFDYGVTFAEPTVAIDTIVDSVSFKDYIAEGETKSYTITPTEDSVWTFSSRLYGWMIAELYDAEGSCLARDYWYSYENNWFTCRLQAGETYTFKIRWSGSYSYNHIVLLFDCEPIVAE